VTDDTIVTHCFQLAEENVSLNEVVAALQRSLFMALPSDGV
jgi:hypothetical protein